MKSQTKSEKIARSLIRYLAWAAILLIEKILFKYLPLDAVGGYLVGSMGTVLWLIAIWFTSPKT